MKRWGYEDLWIYCLVLSLLLGVTCASLFQAPRYCSCAVKSNAKKRVRTLPQVTRLINFSLRRYYLRSCAAHARFVQAFGLHLHYILLGKLIWKHHLSTWWWECLKLHFQTLKVFCWDNFPRHPSPANPLWKGSLFKDPLFSLQSPSSAGDKIINSRDLLTTSAIG